MRMQPGSAPRMPPSAVCDPPQRCAWDADHGGDLGLRAPSAAGERFRFRQQSGLYAVKVTMLPEGGPRPLRSRIGIEAAACGGQPAGHLEISSWHPDRGLMRRWACEYRDRAQHRSGAPEGSPAGQARCRRLRGPACARSRSVMAAGARTRTKSAAMRPATPRRRSAKARRST